MIGFFQLLVVNWTTLIIPIAVFALSLIALLWLRWLAFQKIERWLTKSKLMVEIRILATVRVPSIIWCLIISIYLGVIVSGNISSIWKSIISYSLWTLFTISLALAFIFVINKLIEIYSPKMQLSNRDTAIGRNIVRIIILVLAILIIMEIWGIHTSPILLLIVIVVLMAGLAFRDIVPNWYAGFQIKANHEIKIGDYIKLNTGEEGYVNELGQSNIRIKAQDNRIFIIPNRHLLQASFALYGHPLKRASKPFQFNSLLHLTELTGLKAHNLKEFVDILKNVPDSIIYYHTHHFLEQHFYLTPEPANDFATWASNSLGDEMLGERLASVDTMGFSSLSTLRDRIVSIIEEYLVQSGVNRWVIAGQEFHFMKSVSVILPIPYQAYDLREFAEALREISLGSLYFHMYESKLRLGRGHNDFSSWLITEVDEPDLAKEITRIDPYTYSLEGLRSTLIKLTEKRLK
jgi:small-conductance mechanosensitive channel